MNKTQYHLNNMDNYFPPQEYSCNDELTVRKAPALQESSMVAEILSQLQLHFAALQ